MVQNPSRWSVRTNVRAPGVRRSRARAPLQDGLVEAGEQRHPGPQRGLEVELAGHGRSVTVATSRQAAGLRRPTARSPRPGSAWSRRRGRPAGWPAGRRPSGCTATSKRRRREAATSAVADRADVRGRDDQLVGRDRVVGQAGDALDVAAVVGDGRGHRGQGVGAERLAEHGHREPGGRRAGRRGSVARSTRSKSTCRSRSQPSSSSSLSRSRSSGDVHQHAEMRGARAR